MDEVAISFTHTQPIDWLLPGIPTTGKRGCALVSSASARLVLLPPSAISPASLRQPGRTAGSPRPDQPSPAQSPSSLHRFITQVIYRLTR